MAQLPCIGLYKPCIDLPFGDCAMYFDPWGNPPERTEFYTNLNGFKGSLELSDL